LLVFYYPRDWRMGEMIWKPRPDQIAAIKAKYPGASAVNAAGVEWLRVELGRQDSRCTVIEDNAVLPQRGRLARGLPRTLLIVRSMR
jgi:hypothetical protein